MKNILCGAMQLRHRTVIFFIVAGVAKNMIACISTAFQKSDDDTFIIHKHMKECAVKGLITNSTRPSMFIVLKYTE